MMKADQGIGFRQGRIRGQKSLVRTLKTEEDILLKPEWQVATVFWEKPRRYNPAVAGA